MKKLLEDNRVIVGLIFSDGTVLKVGSNNVTMILACEDWFSIYYGEECVLAERANGRFVATVQYEVST